MCLAKQEPAQCCSWWENHITHGPAARQQHQYLTSLCWEGELHSQYPIVRGTVVEKNIDTCLVSDIRVFILFQMQTWVLLGFYMPEQTSVGKADVKQCLRLCVFFSISWVSSSEQGCKTQDLPSVPSSLGAAGIGPGQVDQSPSVSVPPSPKPTGALCSFCVSKIITEVKGTSELTPGILNDLSKVTHQICRHPGETGEK